MIQILGLLAVMVLVFGALLSAGSGVAHALPLELALIIGSAFGTLVIGNSPAVAAEALSGFWKTLRGSKWTRQDFLDLLSLLHTLTRRARQGGMVAIEEDIETPETSATFQSVPRILADQGARSLICDTLRMMALDLSDHARAEQTMSRNIDRYMDRRMRAVGALHTVADALPALGIVAAVIGIIRTMTMIDQSPSVIGSLMAAALLGTFLGVFLAYAVVGPIAARFGQIIEEEEEFLLTIRAVLSAYAAGAAPLTAIEMGRMETPETMNITSDHLNHALQAARFSEQSARAA